MKAMNPIKAPVEGAAINGLTNIELASVLGHRVDDLRTFIESMSESGIVYTLPCGITDGFLNRCLDALKEVSDRIERDRQTVGKQIKSQAELMGDVLDEIDAEIEASEATSFSHAPTKTRVCKVCRNTFKYEGVVDDNLCGQCSTRLYGDK